MVQAWLSGDPLDTIELDLQRRLDLPITHVQSHSNLVL